MPLISDSLSIWEIAHRWAGLDPDNYRLKLPLLVKDYARILVDAVLNGEIFCETLTLVLARPERLIRNLRGRKFLTPAGQPAAVCGAARLSN